MTYSTLPLLHAEVAAEHTQAADEALHEYHSREHGAGRMEMDDQHNPFAGMIRVGGVWQLAGEQQEKRAA
jgi:hypothetical protein